MPGSGSGSSNSNSTDPSRSGSAALSLRQILLPYLILEEFRAGLCIKNQLFWVRDGNRAFIVPYWIKVSLVFFHNYRATLSLLPIRIPVFRISEILGRIRISGSVPLTNESGCGSVPNLQWLCKIIIKKILKFYFATITSVRSTLLWEKGIIRIHTCYKRIRMRIREAQKHTDHTDPDANSEHW
jgi:hypothetical protein